MGFCNKSFITYRKSSKLETHIKNELGTQVVITKMRWPAILKLVLLYKVQHLTFDRETHSYANAQLTNSNH